MSGVDVINTRIE